MAYNIANLKKTKTSQYWFEVQIPNFTEIYEHLIIQLISTENIAWNISHSFYHMTQLVSSYETVTNIFILD